MKRAIAACLIALGATFPLTTLYAADAGSSVSSEQRVAKINLNTVDAQTLADALKGIGLKKAEAIVAYREQLGGRFSSFEQLLGVKGIGEKTLAKLKPQLSL